ncbi:GAF domain-containing SpoIIE family protein phosphatase [Jatrophihabitans endophyticus]|uniref:GAF domain-containing SpoIIE family protein phosphatase n=1 Tax=Jatrophihabitans endophyticus TaxID=1206085 RepID=UPI0019F3A3D1|nr:SpoIIE family protein phosphatase [Jatrophihabitans endophyticus]MBE7189498.1 SpoIIE family protein phosphatase [Jatrophihabitans endophyticus]
MDEDRPTPDRGLPASTSLGAVADEAFDRISQLVRSVIGVPVALVTLVDVAGQVFPGQAGLPSPWSEERRTPLSHSFCQHVVRSGEPLVVSDARADPRLADNLAIPDLGVVAYAGIPLTDLDGTVVGSLCAIDTEPRAWAPSEISLLTDLAALCNAELRLRTAAETARASQQRADVLLELSETLTGTTTVADVSDAVGKIALSRLDGIFGGVALVDAETDRLGYVGLDGLPDPVRLRYVSFAVSAPLPSSAVLSTGQPLYFENLEQMARDFPEAAGALSAATAGSAAYLPLAVQDVRFGTVALAWATPRTFSADEKTLLAALGRYTAQAVQRALLLADRRDVAETLQAAMLPVLGSSSVAELSARYNPARVADAVGGDWYDAFTLPNGSLAVSIGDVAGHDTEAAAVMGQLHATLRGLTLAMGQHPDRAVSALDAILAQQPVSRHATGILAVLSPGETGTAMTWTNAGHPAPLVLPPGSGPHFLTTPSQLLLGTRFPPGVRRADTTILAPGSTVLFFTDGLIERRFVDPDDSTAGLATSVARHRDLPLPELIDAVLDDMFGELPEDDVAVLALRIPEPEPASAPSS